ncbi:MAG: glycosyltransferase [Alphaproteobacteria bacterium]
MIKQNILGIIRYSCQCFDNKINVFDKNYLDYRFDIFVNVTLKSLSNQTNKDFNIVLLHSENLPDEYKKRFSKLEKEHCFLHCLYLKDGTSVEVASKQAISLYGDENKNIIVTFRIDNDDAISCDFIKSLKKYTKDKYLNCAITMPIVTYAQRVEHGKYLLRTKNYPSNAVGLAYVSSYKNVKSIMDLGHHAKVRKNHKTIKDNNCGGLITLNGANCANRIKNTFFKRLFNKFLSSKQLKKFLSKNFNDVELDCLNIIPYHHNKTLSYSSNSYFLAKEDVLSLEKHKDYSINKEFVILLGNKNEEQSDTLLCGNSKDKAKFIKTRIAYYSYNRVLSFFVHLLKPIKRKMCIAGTNSYRTKLSFMADNKLLCSSRTRETAYAWSNKKWQMPLAKRQERYESLFNSIKSQGFNYKHPLHIGLNRKFGAKDQLLQGNHRISVCNELGIDEVSITFVAYPKVFNIRGKND